MVKYKSQLIITVISLLLFAGCQSGDRSTTETSPTISSGNTTQLPSTAASNKTTDYQGLLTVVTKTTTAVTTGNFTQAKTEFDKFEDSWKTVEDGIKAKSPQNYKAIEDSLDKITAELKGSKPSKEKVLGELQTLTKSITTISK